MFDRMPCWRTAAALATTAWLAGCASLSADDALDTASAQARRAFGREAQPRLHQDLLERDRARGKARELLQAGPLSADGVVRVALLQSPALQARMAAGWQAQLSAQRGTWPAGPHLMLERISGGGEVEITRALALPLLDWVLWPWRRDTADAARQAERLRVAQDLLADCFALRAQWVRAVAARQRLQYDEQVLDSAEAGAELARRMEQAGNFSKLQRAREQLWQVEARMRLAHARLAAHAELEALVRALGLDAALAEQLRLPDRLPDLPAASSDAVQARQDAQATRLDVAVARAEWRRAAGERAARWLSPLDLELTLIRQGQTGSPSANGAELALALPLPDTGATGRQAADAAVLAAAARLDQVQREADSMLRERLAAVQATHAIAREALDELVPLARTVAEENLLRYNGMLIGVFELLADARAQVGAVLTAIDAQRDHWLADNALRAALAGVPAQGPRAVAPDGGGAAPAAGGH
jgi:outer membrane protein TolC